MAVTFLSIGSNSGNRIFFLEKSLDDIQNRIGIIIARSNIYETQAWGFDGENFLNLAVKVETDLRPSEVLSIIKIIENEMGRERVPGQYVDRTIDLDILFYDREIISTGEVVIPHPRLQERLFVLEPLMDLQPEFIHPVLNKTIKQLREECSDKGWIRKFPNC